VIDHVRILDNKATSHQAATSANGKHIFVDLLHSTAGQAIARQPHLLSLIKEVTAMSTFKGDNVTVEYDVKRTVGYLSYIPTKPDDIVFYARQLRASTYTRFIKNRVPATTSLISLRLERIDPESYIIKEVWIGPLPVAIPEPGSTSGEQHEFWSSHAVVYNGQPLVASSTTKDWPY